jgi:peptidoglycan/xylan/chitin deacetylase (PgdA/CDA1 family)
MLNSVLITFSNITASVLHGVRHVKPLRAKDDLRLVFYHGIGDSSSPCFAFLNDEIPINIFRSHLDILERDYTIVPLEEAIGTLEEGNLKYDRPLCSISFDDGLQSVYTHAFPLLKERGITATIFVNTKVVGNRDLLWLHLLNYLISIYGERPISEILNESKPGEVPKPPHTGKALQEWCKENFNFIYESDVLHKIADAMRLNVEEIAQKEKLYLNCDQIHEMTKEGFTFYSHTTSHCPLNKISTKFLQKEIKEARECMLSFGNTFGKFVSFPFGMEKDYGLEAAKYALSCGHDLIFEVGDGCNSPLNALDRKVFSRVCLGEVTSTKPAHLYSAIELKPLIKKRLRRYFNFANSISKCNA